MPGELPATLTLRLERVQDLRYGENPHQQAARYRTVGGGGWWDTVTQHGGKELSYLNLFDAEAAWRLVHRFDEPACVIVKHANPCGVAVAADITTAYEQANACDPVSAFGGIVAVNRPLPAAAAAALAPVFTEVVVAPRYDDEALATLTKKANLRVLSAAGAGAAPVRRPPRRRRPARADAGSRRHRPRRLVGRDAAGADPRRSGTTCSSPGPCAPRCRRTRSCCAKDRQAFGVGAGQQNRVDSARIAATRAAGRAVGGVCASDAYFPFRDGLDVAADAGVAAIIQPGGSIRDAEVIAAADERGVAMVFTGQRHFRH